MAIGMKTLREPYIQYMVDKWNTLSDDRWLGLLRALLNVPKYQLGGSDDTPINERFRRARPSYNAGTARVHSTKLLQRSGQMSFMGDKILFQAIYQALRPVIEPVDRDAKEKVYDNAFVNIPVTDITKFMIAMWNEVYPFDQTSWWEIYTYLTSRPSKITYVD